VERAEFESLSKTLGLAQRTIELARTIRGDELAVQPAADSSTSIQDTMQAEAGSSLPGVQLAPKEGQGGAGDFALGRKIGEGGMGEVFVATQRSLRREVAIKRVKDGHSGAATTALVSEARTAGGLEHPNVVPVHVLGTDEEGRAVLVMKRIDGVSLEDLATDRAHPMWASLEQRYGDRTAATVEVIARVADALEFAHKRSVFHRDVKPENVMIGRHGETYLLDWGVALDRRDEPSERARSIVGTPAFMAPEMLSGDPEHVDARTDVYLLSATLHAALTGTHRHQGETLHAALLSAVLSEPIAYGPEVDPELGALCNRGTSADKSARPPTVSALRDELRRFLRQRGAIARVRRVETQLAELGGSVPDAATLKRPEVAAKLAEARFVLDDVASELDASHPTLLRARATANRAAFELEIARRDPEAAAAIEREITPRDPSLGERVQRLREALREAEALEHEGREAQRERDPRASGRAMAALITFVSIVTLTAIAAIGEPNTQRGALWSFVAMDATVLTMMAVVIAVWREKFFANQYGRAATVVIVTAIGAGAIADVLSALQERTPSEAAPFTLAAIGAPLIAGGGFFGRWMALAGLASLVGAGLCVVIPSKVHLIMVLSEVATMALATPMMRKGLAKGG
jgi:serine/threonine-protein kinase